MELEKHWSKKVGTFFDEKNILNSVLSDNEILDEAKSIDTEFG